MTLEREDLIDQEVGDVARRVERARPDSAPVLDRDVRTHVIADRVGDEVADVRFAGTELRAAGVERDQALADHGGVDPFAVECRRLADRFAGRHAALRDPSLTS